MEQEVTKKDCIFTETEGDAYIEIEIECMFIEAEMFTEREFTKILQS